MSQSADKFRARLPVHTVTAEIRKIGGEVGRLSDRYSKIQTRRDVPITGGVKRTPTLSMESKILSTGPRQFGNKNAQYK